MSKAILVTDMPNECRDCACFDSNDFGTFCGATDKEIKYDYDKYEYTKPNWCPLKEMPKELVYGKTCNDLSYTDGYNACIDKILKGETTMTSISTNEYKIAGRNLIIDICEDAETAKAAVDVKISPLCPHCGESYYRELQSISTAKYYPPIYKDGVNINPDRNTTTTECECLNCGKHFSYTRQEAIK